MLPLRHLLLIGATSFFTSLSASVDTLYISDQQGVSKVTPSGGVSDFSAIKEASIAEDSRGNLYLSSQEEGIIYKFAAIHGTPCPTPIVFATGLKRPTGLAFDSKGNLYEADQKSGIINKFSSSRGVLSRIPKPFATGLRGSKAPVELIIDSEDNLYASILIGGILKFKQTPTGLSTIPVLFASVPRARQMAFDRKGNLFTADHVNQFIYEFVKGPAGLSHSPVIFATDEPLNAPIGIAFDSVGKLYVANWGYGNGENVLQFPLVHGTLSSTPAVFMKGFDAPTFILAYHPR